MIRSLTSRFPKAFLSPSLGRWSNSTGFVVRNSSSDSDSETETSGRLENVDTMKCINRVTLLGRATGPANMASTRTANMATFTLATNELHRNRENELIKRSDFHKVQVFIPRLVEKTSQVLQKGSRVLVEGKITYNVRKGESGNIHYTNIVADNIVFITGSRIKQDREVENEADESAFQN